MGKEWLDEKCLGEVYCKKCRKEGSLVAEVIAVGNNLHIDFYVQHSNEKRAPHFVGRKIFRSLKGKAGGIPSEACHRLVLREGQKENNGKERSDLKIMSLKKLALTLTMAVFCLGDFVFSLR